MKKMTLFAVLFAALFFSYVPAFADIKIGIIDTRKIVEESDAGKSLATQLKTRQDAIQTEASGYEKKLKGEEQDIIAKRKDMKPDEFDAKKKAFEEEFTKSRQTILTKSEALDTQRKAALAELQSYLAKASASIADQQKLQLIVDRQFVILAQEDMDITKEVLAKLNETVKTISLDSAGKK